MKVLLSEPMGGFWPYTPDLANALTRCGCSVSLYTSRRREKSVDVAAEIDYLPVAWTFNNKLSRSKYWAWAFDRFCVLLNWSIGRAVLAKRIKPDLLHLQYSFADVDRYSLNWINKKTPVVLTVHNVFSLREHSEHNRNKKALAEVYSRCKGLIVHTEANRQELLQNFSLDSRLVRVIPHGALPPSDKIKREQAKKELGLADELDYLLIFGGLRTSKGIDIGLEAFAKLSGSNAKLRLIIAGGLDGNTDIAGLKKRAEELTIADKIIWDIRFVPDDVTAKYFCAASVALLPYREFHSQSGVLLHAYRYNLPVVVNDVGGLGETVNSDASGVVSEEITAEGFARALDELLSDTSLQEQCSMNQKSKVEGDYHWDNVAKLTMNFYSEILSGI